jgi:Na+-translocating ferredoxin:NAD+ oxidoreductase RNF subunit RnfB
MLPGIDCGVCGAPTCECFAEDVSKGFAELKECIFFADENIQKILSNFRHKPEENQ